MYASKAAGSAVGGGVGYSVATLFLAALQWFAGVDAFSEEVVFAVHTLIDATCAWLGAYFAPPNNWKPKPASPPTEG